MFRDLDKCRPFKIFKLMLAAGKSCCITTKMFNEKLSPFGLQSINENIHMQEHSALQIWPEFSFTSQLLACFPAKTECEVSY